jgi:hypothetical protein
MPGFIGAAESVGSLVRRRRLSTGNGLEPPSARPLLHQGLQYQPSHRCRCCSGRFAQLSDVVAAGRREALQSRPHRQRRGHLAGGCSAKRATAWCVAARGDWDARKRLGAFRSPPAERKSRYRRWRRCPDAQKQQWHRGWWISIIAAALALRGRYLPRQDFLTRSIWNGAIDATHGSLVMAGTSASTPVATGRANHSEDSRSSATNQCSQPAR